MRLLYNIDLSSPLSGGVYQYLYSDCIDYSPADLNRMNVVQGAM